MADASTPRERLTELIELARTYRGWTRRKLAKSLGRDPSKLVPDSGLPKIDLVIQLAKVLDWPIQDVVATLACNDLSLDLTATTEIGDDFDALEQSAITAYCEGRFADMVTIAQRAYSAARTPTERARACNREAGGWDGQGHYRRALEALQRGLRETDADPARLLLLRSNLANEYYALWQLVEAKGIAGDVIAHFSSNAATSQAARIAEATAFYVRGHCLRRLFEPGRPDVEIRARDARAQLLRSSELFEELARSQNETYAGIRNTCLGGLLECDVILGQKSADDAIAEINVALEVLDSQDPPPVGDWLESYSWWCIFGCNIAIRHLTDAAQLQRTMAVLTSKADELAERLGNWALRERILTMDFVRRQRLSELAGTTGGWTIDSSDMRAITGTMGRFPQFQRTGWEILRAAQKVRDE